MKVTFNSYTGQFNYILEAVIPDTTDKGVVALVSNEGLANLGFRAMGSGVEKVLIEQGLHSKDAARKTVDYSESTAEVIRTAGQAVLDTECKKQGYPTITLTMTGQHVVADSAATKEAEALFMMLVNGVMIDGKLTGGLGERGAIAKLKADSREAAVQTCKVKLQMEKKALQAAALAKLHATFAAMEAA